MDERGRERRRHIEAAFSNMLSDGAIDGIVGGLRRRYPSNSDLVEDALCDAVAHILATAEQRDIEQPVPFLYRAAERRLKRMIWRDRLFMESNDEIAGNESFEIGQVELETTVRMLKRAMSDWPDTVRVVTSITLDAVMNDLFLTSDELAQEASTVLGREIGADSARTWKSRGLTRLRECFAEKEDK